MARPNDRAEAPPRRSPWPYAIALGLGLVIVANAVFIYVAVSGADPIAPSYVAAIAR